MWEWRHRFLRGPPNETQAYHGLFDLRDRGTGFSTRRSGPTPDDEVSDGDLHRLVVLIHRPGSHLDDALIGARLGRPYFEHFDVEMQGIVRSYGVRPAEFIEADADNAARGTELALHEETHGHRRSVPAAGGQALENRTAGGLVVEVKGLGIEFGGEGFDSLAIDFQPPGREPLTARRDDARIEP